MKNALFICGKARQRSPTAAEVTRLWPNIAADYAGLSRDADEPLTPEMLDWATVIFVMERSQKKRVSNILGPIPAGKRLVSLDIPDRYDFMSEDLIAILKTKLSYHFGPCT